MPTYKTKGIIIRRTDLGEADKILTIYTYNLGKVKAVAKGVRKMESKLGGHLELFTLVDLVLASGRNLETVTGAVTLKNFRNLRSNLEKTSLAYFIAELVDKLTPEEHKDFRIFELMEQTFSLLDKKEVTKREKLYLLTRAFEIKFLRLIGFDPELRKCVECGETITPDGNYFSASLGGLLDEKCRRHDLQSFKISNAAVKVLRLLKDEPLEKVQKLKVDKSLLSEIEKTISYYLRYMAERQLKSVDFLKRVERLDSEQ